MADQSFHAVRGKSDAFLWHDTPRREAAARKVARALPEKRPSAHGRIALLLVGAIWSCLTGCVERRMTIRTNVDDQGGALAIINNREVGYTPVSTGFTYYADREIKLIKDGYETVTLVQPIRAPWWDSLPLEFFTENLLPMTLRDEREFRYDMQPTIPVSGEELLQRASQLRAEGQHGKDVPLPGRAGAAERVSF
jgi:hypothetical protein